MAEFLFGLIDFSLKWVIPLFTYIAAIVYAVTTVGKTEKKIGALILGFLMFAGLVVIVIVSGLEDYVPSIELREYPALVVFSLLLGIIVGILFIVIANALIEKEATENLFIAVTIALSLSTFFLHLYIFQIRIALGVITLGALIGVFGKLYIGPGRKFGGGWRDIYKKN